MRMAYLTIGNKICTLKLPDVYKQYSLTW